MQVEIYETTSSWSENTITWSNAPSHGILLKYILIPQEPILIIDLTDSLEDESNLLWSIHLATDDLNYVYFSSRQYWTLLDYKPPEIIYHYKVSDLPIIIGVIVGIGVVSIVGGLIYVKHRKKRKEIIERPLAKHESEKIVNCKICGKQYNRYTRKWYMRGTCSEECHIKNISYKAEKNIKDINNMFYLELCGAGICIEVIIVILFAFGIF